MNMATTLTRPKKLGLTTVRPQMTHEGSQLWREGVDMDLMRTSDRMVRSDDPSP